MRAVRMPTLLAMLAVALVARADGGRYTSTGNTVTDTATGLQWQVVSSNAQLKALYEAFDECENLTLRDFNDWRLPSPKELLSLQRDDGTFDPSLGAPSNSAAGYWSGTYSRDVNKAWIVRGDRMVRATTGPIAYVRCVRP